MVVTHEVLLGLLVGVVLTLIVQQMMKVSNRMLRPGGLVVVGMGLLVLLVATGVVHVPFLSPS